MDDDDGGRTDDDTSPRLLGVSDLDLEATTTSTSGISRPNWRAWSSRLRWRESSASSEGRSRTSFRYWSWSWPKPAEEEEFIFLFFILFFSLLYIWMIGLNLDIYLCILYSVYADWEGYIAG